MQISSSPDPIGPAVEMAVQKMVLDVTRSDGVSIVGLIASTPPLPTSSPSQGHFLDARA